MTAGKTGGAVMIESETLKVGTPLISADAISKAYDKGQLKVPVLRGAGLSAAAR
jgi:hypothetical protein